MYRRQCGAPVEAEQWRERASGRQGAGSGVREQMRVAEAMEGARARGTQGPWASSLGELLGRIWSESKPTRRGATQIMAARRPDLAQGGKDSAWLLCWAARRRREPRKMTK